MRRLAMGALLLSVTAPVFAQTEKQACLDAYEQAQYARRDKHLRAARAHSLVCAQQACGAAATDCSEWLREVEPAIPTIVFGVRSDAGADLTNVVVVMDKEKIADKLDGTAIAVDPGTHTFRFEAQGSSVEQVVTVKEGEKSRALNVVMPAQSQPQATIQQIPATPTPAPTSTNAPTPTVDAPTRASIAPGLVVGSAGLAVVVASVIVGVVAKSDLDSLRSTCAPGCSSSSLDAVQIKAAISDVLLGIGVVATGVGALMIAFRPLKKGPTVGLRGTTLVLSGTF